MTPDSERGARIVEALQELVAHIEAGTAKMRALSLLTIAVAALLTASYVSQLLLPYAFGVTTVTVDLVDPANVAVEILVLVLALLWVYVGLRDYAFSARMARSIREARAKEKEIENQITG